MPTSARSGKRRYAIFWLFAVALYIFLFATRSPFWPWPHSHWVWLAAVLFSLMMVWENARA